MNRGKTMDYQFFSLDETSECQLWSDYRLKFKLFAHVPGPVTKVFSSLSS